MRVLTYGLAANALGGIDTYLLNMCRFMPEDLCFDHVFERDLGVRPEDQDSMHRPAIEARGGRLLYVAPKRDMLANIRDWQRLLKAEKSNTQTVYFNMYSLAWMVPVIMARLHGYRVLVHAHNNNLHDCGKPQRLLHGFFRQVQKCMKITRLTNSRLSADFFFGGKDAELICNAIDTGRFAFDPVARERVRQELGLEGRHVYGFVGRLAPGKNPMFLLDIFHEIEKKDPLAAFLICGEGELLEKMKSKARELEIPVCFAGACPNIQDYYSGMDIFILPSLAEGLGLVLIEAQCSGLPCVTSADVVPRDAKVTELLDYIPLDRGAEVWAELCVDKLKQIPADRRNSAEAVAVSGFEIRGEAPRLGTILRG